MSKKLLECLHGLYWKACVKCKDKTKKEVTEELDLILGKTKEVQYDYQDLSVPEEEIEEDRDYDLDFGLES